MDVRIKVVITDGTGDSKARKREYRANVRADLPESGGKLIDAVERMLLQVAAALRLEGMAPTMAAQAAGQVVAKVVEAAWSVKGGEQLIPRSVAKTEQGSLQEAPMDGSSDRTEVNATVGAPTRQSSVAP